MLNVIGLLFFMPVFVTSLFLYFFLKIVCFIGFVCALRTLKGMFIDYVCALKSLEPFFIGRSTLKGLEALFRNLSIKTVVSFSAVSLLMVVSSLFTVLFLPTALYFIDESICYVFDLFETLIEKYLKHTQNLLINLFKDQENSLNNPSESVTILEKGISDIKFDKVNLQDQTSEDTENYRNLVKKNSNVYIGSIALILAASLLCAITISFYST